MRVYRVRTLRPARASLALPQLDHLAVAVVEQEAAICGTAVPDVIRRGLIADGLDLLEPGVDVPHAQADFKNAGMPVIKRVLGKLGQRGIDRLVQLEHRTRIMLQRAAANGGAFVAKVMEDGPLGRVPSDHTEWTWNGVFHIHDLSDDNLDELERGWILKADTLEELASQIVSNDYWSGEELVVNAEGLKAAVEQWNEGCESGVDAFGRTTGLNKMSKPPYYAIELMPSSLYTISGLKSGINSSVLDWEGEPIPRLYCAGNIGQGVAVSPMGVAACMGNGIIAGRHAAGLENWDA